MSRGPCPPASASASVFASIVPASQYMCRNPRSAYRQPVRHGIPVTTMVVASPIAGGATSRSA